MYYHICSVWCYLRNFAANYAVLLVPHDSVPKHAHIILRLWHFSFLLLSLFLFYVFHHYCHLAMQSFISLPHLSFSPLFPLLFLHMILIHNTESLTHWSYSHFPHTLANSTIASDIVQAKEPNKTNKNTDPPIFDLSLLSARFICSSALRGNSQRKNRGTNASIDVNRDNFHNPSISLSIIASFETSLV